MANNCVLGLCTGKQIAVSSPAITKIGGSAVWHSPESAWKEQLCCKACGESNGVSLVVQVYAPTDIDRSLYVFACNYRQCSLQHKGWMVLRNQQSATPQEQPAQQVSQTTRQDSTATASSSSSSSSKANNSSIWAFDDSDDGDVSLEALTAMVDSRNAALSIPTRSSGTCHQDVGLCNQVAGTVSETEEGSDISSFKWPAWAVVECSEPEEALYIDLENDYSDEEEEDEEAFAESADAATAPKKKSYQQSQHGIDDNHIRRLLQGYLQDEEDSEVVAQLRGTREFVSFLENSSKSQATKKCAVPGRTSSNTGRDKHIESRPAPAASLRGSSNNTNYNDNNSGRTHSDGEDEKQWSRGDRKSRAEQRFEERVALEPTQVLRYDYDGLPLWCTYPSPLDNSTSDASSNELIPPCESCGASRVFELQLMPALLSLPIPSPPERSSARAAEVAVQSTDRPADQIRQQLDERLGKGIDFGVVAIYCCPNSCPGGNREVAIVQPPADFSL